MYLFSDKVNSFSRNNINTLKIKESRYIALYVVNVSIKKLFSSDYELNICLFLIFFFNRFCSVEKCGVTSHY